MHNISPIHHNYRTCIEMEKSSPISNLIETGPLVQAEIFPNVEAFLKLKNFGMPETFAPVKMLIDTGSNISGLDASIIQILKLEPVNGNDEWVRGEAGVWQAKRYNCVLYMDIFRKKALNIEVLAGNYLQAGFQGVLGRDVLRFCHFRYDGINNRFTLTARGF